MANPDRGPQRRAERRAGRASARRLLDRRHPESLQLPWDPQLALELHLDPV